MHSAMLTQDCATRSWHTGMRGMAETRAMQFDNNLKSKYLVTTSQTTPHDSKQCVEVGVHLLKATMPPKALVGSALTARG